jgi:hypothetical protein
MITESIATAPEINKVFFIQTKYGIVGSLNNFS